MRRKKFYIILLIFVMICFSNVVLAAKSGEYGDTWDEFYDYFVEQYDKDGGAKLTDEEVERMVNGPTEYERTEEGSVKVNYNDIQDYIDKAKNLKETRAQGGTNVNEKKWEDAKAEAEDLYNKLLGAKTDKDKIDYAKKLQEKINEMRTYDSKGTLEKNAGEVNEWNGVARTTLESLGEEAKDNYEGQVGNDGEVDNGNDKIFKWPTVGEATGKTKDGTLSDMISDADSFLQAGNDDKISQDDLKSLSRSLYNILLQIGVGLSVIIGLVLGIKFMLAGVEEKAEVKKMMWVYVVGCVVTFGAFGIWKIVVSILQQI